MNVNLEVSRRSFPVPPPQHSGRSLSVILKICSAVAITAAMVFVLIGFLGLAGSASPWFFLGVPIALGFLAIAALVVGVKEAQWEQRLKIKVAPAEDALRFSERYLNENKDKLEPYSPVAGERPPKNLDIPLLDVLAKKKHQELQEFLQANNAEDISHLKGEALEKAYEITLEWLQLSFTVSFLALSEASSYREIYPQIKSNLEAAGDSRFYCSTAVLSICKDYKSLRLSSNADVKTPDKEETERVARFYKLGTPEFKFRMLYNYFCDQACLYFGEELNEAQSLRERFLARELTPDLNPQFTGRPQGNS
ncbi:hypothetical protein [Chlamydia vaughanii]|uniref:hypothetical protein n=1 Tax=Chlamydia vaughanii TaxID=3112552 RepID=UPI0032B2B3BE